MLKNRNQCKEHFYNLKEFSSIAVLRNFPHSMRLNKWINKSLRNIFSVVLQLCCHNLSHFFVQINKKSVKNIFTTWISLSATTVFQDAFFSPSQQTYLTKVRTPFYELNHTLKCGSDTWIKSSWNNKPSFHHHPATHQQWLPSHRILDIIQKGKVVVDGGW